jgi:NAD(P)-dependent dehydrogenase (short-subunit alcohol dehydrogenase family)
MVVANSAPEPRLRRTCKKAIPAKRGGTPAELAAAAVWLCSAEASYIGGMTNGGSEPS